MTLPANYIVEHRNVKHARLRVNEDGSVHLFVPNSFTEEEVSKVLEMMPITIHRNTRIKWWSITKVKRYRQEGIY